MLFIDSLFTPFEMVNQTKIVYPFSLRTIAEALENKIEEDPDFEVWANLVYFHHVEPSESAERIAPYKYFVSNKGRVVNLRDPEDPKYLEETLVDNKIPTVSLIYKKTNQTLDVARAVACSFVFIPDSIVTYLPRNLIVGYRDNDPTNVSANNLEWKLP